MSKTKIRLLHVVVQPVWVIDDGEHLELQEGPQTVVRAADWPAFPERLEADRLQGERNLGEPS